ncbi:hypothetical protein [uncultured Ruegeria sp.]|uniref:hypothetical protein n=1 Tax=uncultured Ruegeria sp. TaxID=259304 RepID=UPI002616E1B2|nr:hypothetical protein [uncultured Ruegeria sp.]
MPETLFINNKWVAAVSGSMFDVDPSNNQAVNKVDKDGSDDIEAAVSAPRTTLDCGFRPWVSGTERAFVLRKTGAEITLDMDGFMPKADKEPIRSAGAIIPWNFPMLMAPESGGIARKTGLLTGLKG